MYIAIVVVLSLTEERRGIASPFGCEGGGGRGSGNGEMPARMIKKKSIRLFESIYTRSCQRYAFMLEPPCCPAVGPKRWIGSLWLYVYRGDLGYYLSSLYHRAPSNSCFTYGFE